MKTVDRSIGSVGIQSMNVQLKKGGGITLQRAEAELIYPDGRVVTRQKEVNKAVIEILGLDRNQFLQIAMIAQGDFF